MPMGCPNSIQGKLTLCNQELEKVSSYRYLGVPMRHDGIDFQAYFTNVLKNARIELQYLKSMDIYLPNMHRIHLVKSQVISKLEYALPILSKWLSIKNPKESRIKRETKKSLQDLIKECRQWAGNTGNKRVLAAHLTNIHDIEQIMQEREAGLVEQLRNINKEHPLIKILENEEIFPQKYKQESILFKCLKSKIKASHEEYQRQNVKKTNLKTFIKKQRQQNYIQQSKLAAYTCQTDNKHSEQSRESNIDIVYRIKSDKVRRKAIAWRKGIVGFIETDAKNLDAKNRFNIQHYCKNCHVKFTREHVNHCPLIVHYPAISRAKWRKFKENSERIQKLSPEATGYTIIDDVLNSFNISLFKELMLLLDNNLEIVSKVPQKEKISKQQQTKVTRVPKEKRRVGESRRVSMEGESSIGQKRGSNSGN